MPDIIEGLPEIDTNINPDNFASDYNKPKKADVELLSPPVDIDAAQIDDGAYTPYTEVLGEVDDNATVEGRLNGLLSQDSNYMRQAAARGTQAANSRGMLNSSMAAGSAQGAMMDRALPVAQQDAATYFKQNLVNQGYSNDAAQWLSDTQFESEKLNTGLDQDTNTFNATNTLENDRINADVTNEANAAEASEWNKNNFAVLSADLTAQLAEIDQGLAERLAVLNNEYSILENLDSVNGSIYQQMIAEIGSIMANEDKLGTAQSKVNSLIEAAGVEFAFSNGTTPAGGSDSGTTAASATTPSTGSGITPIEITEPPELTNEDYEAHTEGDRAGGKQIWHWTGDEWIKRTDPDLEGGGGPGGEG